MATGGNIYRIIPSGCWNTGYYLRFVTACLYRLLLPGAWCGSWMYYSYYSYYAYCWLLSGYSGI